MTYPRGYFLSLTISTSLILFCSLLVTACFSEQTPIILEEEAPKKNGIGAKSWGAFEATHIDFISLTANQECPPEGQGIYYVDPIPKLIELAQDYEIVMINEAHYKPIHRAFIGELAKALKEVNYGMYGAETFSPKSFSQNNRNPELESRGYPILTDGFYTKEPIYGQLIETLLHENYEFFAYESITPSPSNAKSQIAHRDSEQAKNILKELNMPSNKKMLIHAGYHHIRETKDNSDNTWMAQYFTEFSNIDPLTISQTECYGKDAFDTGVLGYAMPVKEDGTPITLNGFDVIVIPPLEAQHKDRPLWLKTNQARKFIDIPSHLKRDDQYTRVTAFDLNKVEGAIIEDTIYRPPFSDKPMALRPGVYRIEVTNKDKVILIKDEISVP